MSRLQKGIVFVSVFVPLVMLAYRLGQVDAWADGVAAWTPREVVVIR